MYIDMNAEACCCLSRPASGEGQHTLHAAARRVCQAGSSPCGVVESEISESRFSTNTWWGHNLSSAESGFASKTEEAARSRNPRIIPDMIPMRKKKILFSPSQWKILIAIFESDENRHAWRRSKHRSADCREQNTEYRKDSSSFLRIFCPTQPVEKQRPWHPHQSWSAESGTVNCMPDPESVRVEGQDVIFEDPPPQTATPRGRAEKDGFPNGDTHIPN